MPSQLGDTLLISYELRLFTVESATQFVKTLKQCDECYCFMLNFTNRAAHSSDKVAEINQHSEQMLNELEKKNPDMLSESIYFIWKHIQPL